jgi:hypothetical protein
MELRNILRNSKNVSIFFILSASKHDMASSINIILVFETTE